MENNNIQYFVLRKRKGAALMPRRESVVHYSRHLHHPDQCFYLPSCIIPLSRSKGGLYLQFYAQQVAGRERERDDMERKIVLQYLGFGVQRRVVVVRQTRRSRDSNPSRASKSSSLTLSSHTGRSVKVENKRKKKKGLRTE